VKRTLVDHAWPASRLGEALRALGRRSGGETRGVEADDVAPPADLAAEGGRRLEVWIEAAADWLGLEAVPIAVPYPDLSLFLGRSGVALLRLPDQAEPRFLILLGDGRRRVRVLNPDLVTVWVASTTIVEALCKDVEAPRANEVERLLAEMGLTGRRRLRVRTALFRQYLATTSVGGCWLVRSPGSSSLLRQAREQGLPHLLARFLIAQVLAQGVWVLSWWLLGGLALSGRLDPGWLVAWLLLVLTLIPIRLVATSTGGLLAIQGGAVLKRRLLFGALNLEPDEVRTLGIGQLLGRVLECGVLESMALTGGFLGIAAVIELVIAGIVLGLGAGGLGHVALLFGAILATARLGHGYAGRLRRWTEERLAMTDDLVERMAGHRTRLAQQDRGHWHEGEDQALVRYLETSQHLDRSAVALQMLVPRGWFLAALLGLAPAFLTGGQSPGSLAVAIGGLVLAYRALRDLTEGLERVAAAAVAWERVTPFWRAADRREPLGHPQFATSTPAAAEIEETPSSVRPCYNGSLLDVRNLVFRHRDRTDPVLQGVSVHIRTGDRLLLEGPSGGGKSTLAALLAGCRPSAAGLMLLDGLDRETLGAERWRRRVVLAPQFHENHVFTGTLAFNALMGGNWPPRAAELDEAGRVCHALGLGPLLTRMPAGLQQMVGETGWQLSHGERSRLYIARALLQGADLLILDESVAALDPETLHRTLAFVVERAPTVLVIAHP
jgi:ATP-binding cassette, subfamily B, bacterial